jgi:hypothetical protein
MAGVITKVRIEYEDGSAREVIGAEDCATWSRLANAQAGLWASRGWPSPAVRWHEFPPSPPEGGGGGKGEGRRTSANPRT